MIFFELDTKDISDLNDNDLRELVARLCEAELNQCGSDNSCVYWGGAQEAPDGGLDVRIKNSPAICKSGFIPKKDTGFQVKKHSMSKAACSKEMQDQKETKPIIIELASKNGAYIIVSGKDDCSDKMYKERIEGMRNALDSSIDKNNIKLDFYGRDRISSWLRKFPGVSLWVRVKLGKSLSAWQPFGRWATPINQDDEFLTDEHPCVTDKDSCEKSPISLLKGIELVRDRLREESSIVRITGLSGVGKTRFAQALFEDNIGKNPLPKNNVIYADLGEELNPSANELINYLITNGFTSYVVLDNCNPDVHRRIQKKISSAKTKLRLLTIEYDITDDTPEETKVIYIEPSSEANTSKLLQKRFPKLERVNADTISKFAGGNARIAIALANRVKSSESLTNFSDEELFKRLFTQRKEIQANLLESAEILSLVYSFNTEEKLNDELNVLAKISSLNRQLLFRSHSELFRRQLLQKRGYWGAILPHALANRLACRALENISQKEINIELLKKENIRLLKSCAHRISYLHNFHLARELASIWLNESELFSDIYDLNEDLMTVFVYIAPVLPEQIIQKIESSSINQNFQSLNTKHYSKIINLLSKLAYDEQFFEQTSSIILKFAENEDISDNNAVAIKALKNLYFMLLSGTNASPHQRQIFLSKLMHSNKTKHFEIAYKLFESAFKTSHWMSFQSFEFGARKRDYGWKPNTLIEIRDWYCDFINLLIPFLKSDKEEKKNFAKNLIGTNFAQLYTQFNCFDYIEKVIQEHISNEDWLELWFSLKGIIHNAKDIDSVIFNRLKALEKLSSPSSIFTKINAYVFKNIYEHREIIGKNFTEKSNELIKKIITLGKEVALKFEIFDKLTPKIWTIETDALEAFGRGLALGSKDLLIMFDLIIKSLKKEESIKVKPYLIRGFIIGTYQKEPIFVKHLYKQVLKIKILEPYYIFLLLSVKLDSWTINKLIELASSKRIDASKFIELSNSHILDLMSDNELYKLLSNICNLKNGLYSVIEILGMYFLNKKHTKDIIDTKIFSFGRKVILKSCQEPYDISNNQIYLLENIVAECFSKNSPKKEIKTIINVILQEMISDICISQNYYNLVNPIIKRFPEEVLNIIIEKNITFEDSYNNPFQYQITGNLSGFNYVPIEQLIKWCAKDEVKIKILVSLISIFIPVDNTKILTSNVPVKLSEHFKSLLNISENKTDLIETLMLYLTPSCYSGYFYELLEEREKALSELLNSPTLEVRELISIKIKEIKKDILANKNNEHEVYSRLEQSFE